MCRAATHSSNPFGFKSAKSARQICRSLVSPLTVRIASYSNPWYSELLCLLVVITNRSQGAVRSNASATALPSSVCHLSIFFGDVDHEFVPGSAHCNNQYVPPPIGFVGRARLLRPMHPPEANSCTGEVHRGWPSNVWRPALTWWIQYYLSYPRITRRALLGPHRMTACDE